jgi:glutathione S-transferase
MEDSMQLYFGPLACSMATRIALLEAGADRESDATFTYVDTRAKRTAEGEDYLAINPLGTVPALRLEDGTLVLENQAILQYVADRYPAAALAPPAGIERTRLQQWLSFVATELHKAVFIPLLTSAAPEGAKAWARQLAPARFAVLERHLAGREFLLDRFTVADAYLATVLNWGRAAGIDYAEWPAVKDYFSRMLKRASVAKALAEEFALYQEQEQRRKAA